MGNWQRPKKINKIKFIMSIIEKIPGINPKVSSYLNLTVLATVFSIFAFIFDVNYIFYGLITIAYGFIAQTVDNLFDFYFEKKYDSASRKKLVTAQTVLILVWVGTAIFYSLK